MSVKRSPTDCPSWYKINELYESKNNSSFQIDPIFTAGLSIHHHVRLAFPLQQHISATYRTNKKEICQVTSKPHQMGDSWYNLGNICPGHWDYFCSIEVGSHSTPSHILKIPKPFRIPTFPNWGGRPYFTRGRLM